MEAKVNIGGCKDRISMFPEPILQHILCFLDQKSAVQTWVLSTAWRYLWFTRPKVEFVDPAQKKEAFLSMLDRTLQGYHDRKLPLQKFCLWMLGAECDDHLASILNKWIPVLIQDMGVKSFHLTFNYTGSKFELPSLNFESDSIQNFTLEGCMLKTTTHEVRRHGYFKNLQRLRLLYAYISEEILDDVLSNSCPFIEHVTLWRCTGFASIKCSQPTNLKQFTFYANYDDIDVSIEIGDDVQTLRTLDLGQCLFSVNHYQLFEFSHLTSLVMQSVKLSSDFFLCNLPCLEELRLVECPGIKEFNLTSHRAMKRLDINNPNKHFKVTVNAPSIVSFRYQGILPQSFYFATTTCDESKIDLTSSKKPSHSFNELIGLLIALSQSEITLELNEVEIHRFWSQLHIEDDGSSTNNIVGVSEAKLPVVVEHLTIKKLERNSHSSAVNILNMLFHMFRPSFICIDMDLSSITIPKKNELHEIAELLFKEREMAVPCNFWERVLEEVRLQVLYPNQNEWQTVRYSRLTEFCKKGEARRLQLHLKWR